MTTSASHAFTADAVARAEQLVDRFAAGGPGVGQPGVAWGALAAGRPTITGGVGELRAGGGCVPDADSVFRIASMTKSYTAAALLVLRDAGRLSLDDPVAAHVPELADVRLPTLDSPALTLRHLLTMSGGLPTDDPWGDRQQGLDPEAFGAFLRGGLSFAWAPGTAFEYSNLGYAILGRAITAVAGLDYADAVRELVLDPLGLASTRFDAADVGPARLAAGHRAPSGPARPATGERTWTPVPLDPYGAFAPMGGLFSSVRDLMRWMAGFLDAFPPRDEPAGEHPLSRASRREMQQQHRAIPLRLLASRVDEPAAGRAGGYGFGLVVEHDPAWGAIVSHSGGYPGFGSHMRWHPDSGVGVVVLANSTYAPASVVAAQLLTILLAAHRDATSPVTIAAAGQVPIPAIPTVRPALRPAAPAPGGVWPQTLAAMAAVERLLAGRAAAQEAGWAQAAHGLLAANIDLDEPIAVRRARFAQAAALAGSGGAFARDPAAPPVHDSPAHALWWLRGRLGRVRLEIRLTPHPEPLVQTLSVTAVPEPGPVLAAAIRAVADQTAAGTPGWPRGLAVATGLDVAAATRALRVGAAYAGPCRIGTLLACDGERTALVRLVGARAALDLSIEVDPAGAVRRLSLAHPEQGFAATD